MIPSDPQKKTVPEWLNSSLWSSPNPVTPKFSPTRLPVIEETNTAQNLQNQTGSDVSEDQGIESEPKCVENGLLNQDKTSFQDAESTLILEEAGSSAANDASTDENLPSLEEERSETEVPSEGPPFSPLPSFPGHATPTAAGPSVSRCSSFDSRVTQFNAELLKSQVSIKELQRLALQGIPDSGSIRATTWKLLLGYLPRSRDMWDVEFEKKRAEYASFKEELLVTPSEVTRRKEVETRDGFHDESKGFLPRRDITHDDHPLSLGKSSVWHQFFLDSEVCEQIDRDVKRTHPDMQFFSGDSEASLNNQEAMKRVLFIFAKLNPGIRYVQGMNEVLAPLYYVFRTDADEVNAANAEPDSFFCFVALLGDFRDHFVQQLDNSAVGIRSTIASLSALLKRHDEELWRHLELNNKVNPQFYAFRWITLLLTQEFNFPDSLRLWDSLLGNSEGPLEILLRVCCAMLMSVRSRLLAGDFTANLKLLQHYPSIDIHHLLRIATELKEKDFLSS